MIGRRTFSLGLGALLLPGLAQAASPLGLTAPAAGPAAAGSAPAPAKPLPKPKKKPPPDAEYVPIEQIPNHRQLMRDVVLALSAYAKKRNPNFIILVRNAPELLIKEQREWKWEDSRDLDGAADGRILPVGSVIRPYLRAIDGMVVDGAFVGHDAYGQPTDPDLSQPLLAAAAALKKEGRAVFSIDYAKDKAAAEAQGQATKAGFIPYVDQDGDKLLGRISTTRPAGENPNTIDTLMAVKNWLPMLHSERYASRADWVTALCATNHDMLLLDTFWRGSDPLTVADVQKLHWKAIGARRLVLGTMPVGRANDGRYYWKPEWKLGSPPFLARRDPDDQGQMIVQYWSDDWKAIIGKYMIALADLGLDGVVLDYIDAYLPFEDLMPID